MTTMKTIVFEKFGEPREVLAVRDVAALRRIGGRFETSPAMTSSIDSPAWMLVQ